MLIYNNEKMIDIRGKRKSRSRIIVLSLVIGLVFISGFVIHNITKSSKEAIPKSAAKSSVLQNKEGETKQKHVESSVSRLVSGSVYKIDVSVGEQKVRVFHNGTLIKEWVVSTGKNNCTPMGQFTVKNKGKWFFSEKYQQGARWWVSFQGNYLFHSIPMDSKQRIIPEEAEKLGAPVSHGCIRLRIEDAKWLYDHIPLGTPVIIHN